MASDAHLARLGAKHREAQAVAANQPRQAWQHESGEAHRIVEFGEPVDEPHSMPQAGQWYVHGHPPGNPALSTYCVLDDACPVRVPSRGDLPSHAANRTTTRTWWRAL